MARRRSSAYQTQLINLVLEAHATLEIVWPSGAIQRYSSRALTVGAKTYEAGLLANASLLSSAGAAVDRTEVQIRNEEWQTTRLLIAAAQMGKAPKAVVGKAIRSHIAPGEWLHAQIMTGIVVASGSVENGATLQVLSDLYAAGSVGALEPVQALCVYPYRDPETCGYTGTLPTCDLTLKGANGCETHNNAHRHGGRLVYDTSKDTTTLPGGGGGGGGGGGNIGGGGGGGSITDDGYRKFEPDLY